MEDMVVIVGKMGDFLRCYISHAHLLPDVRRTLGLRMAALEPANLAKGRIAKLLIVAGAM